MNQNLNEEFLTACVVGDIFKIKDLYNTYYPPNKNIFDKFTNIFNFKKPLLNPHYKYELPLITACLGGHLDVINFLLKEKRFVNNMSSDRLILCLGSALQNEHIQIANVVLPFIKKKNQDFEDCMYSSFQNCCRKGQLDVLKYILNEKKINVNIKWLDLNKGFKEACENSHINIIEYFVKNMDYPFMISEKSSKNPKNLIRIENIDVLHFFVNEINMQKNDGLYIRLLLDENMQSALNHAFENKELYQDLIANLNTKSNQSLSRNKKIKL